MQDAAGGKHLASQRKSGHRWRVVPLAIVAVLLSACTTVVNGSAVWAPGEAPPGVDVALLDTGNYPRTPQPPLGEAGTPEKGLLLEAARMASNVVGPWEIDTRLTEAGLPYGIIAQAGNISQILGNREVAAAAGKHNFVNGFISTRRSEPEQISLVNAVLRFADPQGAAAAAAEFAAFTATPEANQGGPPGQPVPVPNHDGTLATTFTRELLKSAGRPMKSVSTFTAYGPYVLALEAGSYDGLDAAMALIVKALDMQKPAIDRFKPTDPAAFPTLPQDPTGVLARTVPLPPDSLNINDNLVYDQHAALHFQMNPVTSAKLFSDTDMQAFATSKTSLYETRDAAGATRLVEQFGPEAQLGGAKPADGVPHMPDSRCFEKAIPPTSVVFFCFASADRYAIEASAPQLPDAHQQVAAQYVMLTAK